MWLKVAARLTLPASWSSLSSSTVVPGWCGVTLRCTPNAASLVVSFAFMYGRQPYSVARMSRVDSLLSSSSTTAVERETSIEAASKWIPWF